MPELLVYGIILVTPCPLFLETYIFKKKWRPYTPVRLAPGSWGLGLSSKVLFVDLLLMVHIRYQTKGNNPFCPHCPTHPRLYLECLFKSLEAWNFEALNSLFFLVSLQHLPRRNPPALHQKWLSSSTPNPQESWNAKSPFQKRIQSKLVALLLMPLRGESHYFL